jgi:predicted Zn-dependent peptidase
MVDRQKAPELRIPEQIRFQLPQADHLSNGLPVYRLEAGVQEVFKMELVFKAGRRFDRRFVLSQVVPPLFKEGSKTFDSASLAKAFDKYGLNIKAVANPDVATIQVYGLKRHLAQALPLLSEMIRRPAFPKKEVNNFLRQREQKLKQKMQKNQFLANRELLKNLFGKNHPLGSPPEPGQYESISHNDLTDFHKKHYGSGACTIFISGQLPSDTLDMMENHLGKQVYPESVHPQDKVWPVEESQDKNIHIELEDKVQTALSIGMRTIPRDHVEFPEWNIVNTLLGGFFGSRLMKNIREEKGYTYGIYSSIINYRSGSYFSIDCECDKSYREKVVEEIFREVNRLRTEPASDQELSMVRNYMMGKLLSQVDGPFNQAALTKALIMFDLDETYVFKLLETISNIGPERIKEVAHKYLEPENLYQIAVG